MTIARNLSFLAEGVSSTGVLGATYGGTGQSSITTGDLLYGSASNTISKLAIGSTGTILRVVAGVPSWGTDYTGTVTSVAATVPSFLSISGSPITSSGTLAITYSGTALPTANGGTALTSFTANGVLYASSSSVLATGSSLQFDGTNLGVGGSALSSSAGRTDLTINGSSSSIVSWGVGGTRKSYLYQDGTDFTLFNEASGAIRLGAGGAERMRIFNSGGVSIGNTTDPGATNLSVTGVTQSTRVRANASGVITNNDEAISAICLTANGPAASFQNSAGSSSNCIEVWNTATTGDNKFINFITEVGYTPRGSISYNRASGLVAYNVTSDYRAKDIISPVLDSGEVIDSVPVYMGKMKDATQARPMFIAHETPDYAHTGEKDAVDKNGNPVYQQMDASSLVPILWAEIQSLRARLKAANIA